MTIHSRLKHIKIHTGIIGLTLVIATGCNMNSTGSDMEKWKKEIIAVEQDFARKAKEAGIANAFLEFCADDAVLIRNDKIISGATGIREYFTTSFWESVEELKWSPDFVDVSSSGDLGYTYGTYTLKYCQDDGQTVENSGIYHTVWKRQDDGSWKFVFD